MVNRDGEQIMTYIDPFLGEIELTKIGETSKHMMGESVIYTVYKHNDRNEFYYVDTHHIGGKSIPMELISKKIINLINVYEKR